ncbi:MAG: hypothetical protein HC904_14965 [Blastochloris sp.]|nr:hypothetical protein [Blastochloris sp.]
MLRVSNNGVTAMISEKGIPLRILEDPVTGSIFEEGVMRASVAIPAQVETLYARWGDWVVWVSLGLLGVYGFLRWSDVGRRGGVLPPRREEREGG